MKRFAALAVTMVLVTVACGGGSETGGDTSPSGGDTQPSAATQDAERVTAYFIDQLGAEDGIRALLLAMERGHSSDQILALGTGGLAIGINGVLGRDGAEVAPEGPPLGLIILPEGELGESGFKSLRATIQLPPGPIDLDGAVLGFLDNGPHTFTTKKPSGAPPSGFMSVEHAMLEIFSLLTKGFSAKQVTQLVTATALGFDVRYEDTPAGNEDFDCHFMSFEGEVIRPTAEDAFCAAVTFPDPSASTTSTTATTGSEASGDFSFGALLEGDGLGWFWTGAFSIVGNQLVGSGTVTGSADTTCSIDEGPEYPVVYTGSGSYDITGTAGESTMLIVLSPTGGKVDVTTGDTSQLCVDISIDISRVLAEFPMGNVELTDVPLELPIGGGQTSLDFGGFVFDVAARAN